MEGPLGLEPRTPCLKGRCSNRLSYGPLIWQVSVKPKINFLHYAYFCIKVNPITGRKWTKRYKNGKIYYMERAVFYPYPNRPGSYDESFFAGLDYEPGLSEAERVPVLDFESNLYNVSLDEFVYPTAFQYQTERANDGEPLDRLETIWQKNIKVSAIGIPFFMTEEGRKCLAEQLGVSAPRTIPEIERMFRNYDYSNVDSKSMDLLENQSVEYEEVRAVKSFIANGCTGEGVPDPKIMPVFRNPEVLLEKIRGYRAYKQYLSAAKQDVAASQDMTEAEREAKLLVVDLYKGRVNRFLSDMYVDAYKFLYFSRNGVMHNPLLFRLERELPAFYASANPEFIARFLQRIDRYQQGVDKDELGDYTWFSSEAKALVQQVPTANEEGALERGEYRDIDVAFLREHEATPETIGAYAREVLSGYGILSEETEWDSDRETAASDGKWQVVVNGKFKNLSVNSKQKIVKVPEKPLPLGKAITLISHELTHALQHENKERVSDLAILQKIGLGKPSEQHESGALWQEREAKRVVLGEEDSLVHGVGYQRMLAAKMAGKPYGALVYEYYDQLRIDRPELTMQGAAQIAVNRARRLYRGGGKEYAIDNDFITNSQPMSYLEQELIYKSLGEEKRTLLFIGGVPLASMVELVRVGLIDVSRMVIPEKRPWEILAPAVHRAILQVQKSQ